MNLRGRVSWYERQGERLNVDFGLDRYFMQEGTAKPVEDALRARQRVQMEIAVASSGHARIRQLLVDGVAASFRHLEGSEQRWTASPWAARRCPAEEGRLRAPRTQPSRPGEAPALHLSAFLHRRSGGEESAAREDDGAAAAIRRRIELVLGSS